MSLRAFLGGLQEEGLLEQVPDPTSPFRQVAERSWRAGPILFGDVLGHRCCLNLLGSRMLLARALGIPAEEMVHRLGEMDYTGQVKEVNSSPFQEVESEPDLFRLPILTHFQGDGGPYITAGVVVSELDGRLNACVHRLMVMEKDRLAARLVPGRHTHQLYLAARELGKDLPVAIALGVDPTVLIAASTRVPPDLEFQYASALRGGAVEVVRLENGVPVPHAEIVLEGYITGERAREGPFVDITGTRDLVREEPVVRLTRMMIREDFIYQGLLPASGEHQMLMGIPYEPLIFKAVSRVAKVKDVVLTEGGCYYFHAVVQIEKETEEDPRRAIEAAMQAHRSLKHVLVVDTDIDIHSPADLEYAIATRVKGDEDIVLFPNVRGSTLDPRSNEGITTKVGVNATATLDRLWKFERVAPSSAKRD